MFALDDRPGDDEPPRTFPNAHNSPWLQRMRVQHVFEQRERWLEELRAHGGREEAVTGSSGRMSLVAIAAEIVNPDADERT